MFRDAEFRDFNWNSIRALVAWLLISIFLFMVGWASLHGRGDIAGFFGFVLTMIAFAPMFMVVGLMGGLRGIRHLRESRKLPWGLYVHRAIFLSAASVFAFDAWLIRSFFHH